jgi:hypothetical protein
MIYKDNELAHPCLRPCVPVSTNPKYVLLSTTVGGWKKDMFGYLDRLYFSSESV